MRIVGLQMLLWGVTGLYMVSMDIHFIHGEHLQSPPSKLDVATITYPLPELLLAYPDASDISIKTLLGIPVYAFSSASDNRSTHLIDARTGTVIPLVTEQQAREIAVESSTINANIKSAELIHTVNRNGPKPFKGLWLVTYDDFAESTLYIEQESGDIIRRRHNYWYLFDWMWRLHIMDYDDGENVTNLLLRIASILGLTALLAGIGLLWFRLKPARHRV